MKVRVTLLRSSGRRLKRSELAPAVEGRLELTDWGPPNGFKRWTRKAELLGPIYGGMEPAVLKPIFDANVMRIDQEGMVIQGVELCQEDESLSEFIQVWHCQPILE